MEQSQDLVEGALRGSVESGSVESGMVEIAGKGRGEIANQLSVLMGDFVTAAESNVQAVTDYRRTLLSRAQAEAGAGHGELAITL